MRCGYGYSTDKDGNVVIYAPKDPADVENGAVTINISLGDIPNLESIVKQHEESLEGKAKELGIAKEELIRQINERARVEREEMEKKASEWKY
jgi:hypothetical protein